MSMVVQHNMQAANANRMLGITTGAQSKSTEKLSSGYKINRAADDAAGLSISEKMRKQIRGLDKASSNAQDGVSAVQTAEGALTEVHSMLQRMNELATQAANGTNSKDTDRKAIQDEMDQLTTEIDRVSETTKFNETYLLKGNGKTETKTVNAHDAGLAGKLVDNGNGTTTFTADELKVGSKVTIAGMEYTIGKSADVGDYAKAGALNANQKPAKTGDSVTHNGVTTTIVDKVTTADATATGKWTAGDKFTDADGKEWSVIADTGTTDATKGEVKITDVATYLKDGSTITKCDKLNVGMGKATDIAKKLTVSDALESTEVSRADATGITNMADNAVAGDIVTANGTSVEITAETPTSMEDVSKAIKDAGKGDTIKIGTKSYTLGVTTDKSTNTYTADDLISMVKEGDTIEAGGHKYTAIGASATDSKAEKSITLNEAYNKMAEELTKASSIGTDAGKGATVSNKGNGLFEIKNGSVDIKSALSFSLHVGADADMTNKINVDIDSMSAAGLGIKGLNISDDNGASATYAIDAISDAISKVSSQRSALGAVQNRLEHTIDNLDNVSENTSSAESRIRDTDMAKEMVNYSKNNILAQAGQSMLAQANQSNQGVLSLLQ